ncbi:spore coat protein [Paenibacillus sp. UMB4589-SE434]|uniref:spore coat protein n=1 Tax=Paenibacillus sp. UMB4589-SE434 TaxID=3046314 RepID=UPI00254ABD8B|nr:spore coat protein [Paenibacillus sp. UMB4589-SE434]MDK8181253.1 spore coat protein [Paenibacillus sp. UMB4589-SE434]
MRWFLRIFQMTAIIVIVGIISSLLTIGTTALVVDRYIQSAISQYNIPIQRQSMTVMTMWASLWGGEHHKEAASSSTGPNNTTSSSTNEQAKDISKADDANESRTNDANTNTQQGHSDLGASSQGDKLGQSNRTSGEDGQKSTTPQEKDGALPVWGSVSTEEANGQSSQLGNQEEVVMSPEALTQNKDQLSAEAKNKVFTTLMKKLPQEGWQRISTLMEGGLTSSEMTEVEQILAKHLDDEQYKEMRQLLTGTDPKTQP